MVIQRLTARPNRLQHVERRTNAVATRLCSHFALFCFFFSSTNYSVVLSVIKTVHVNICCIRQVHMK